MKRLFLILISVFFFSCSSSDDEIKNDGDDPSDVTDPGDNDELHIGKAFFIDSENVKNKTSDPRFLDKMVELVSKSTDDSSIFLSVYGFSYEPLMDALLEASGRGVAVHALVDSSKASKREAPVFTKLKDLKKPSEIIGVNNTLRGGAKAINHNKYMLFSEVETDNGIAENIVFASSHNFSKGASKKVQDGLLIAHDELYKAFEKNWHDVADLAHDRQGMKNFVYTKENVGDGLTVRFFPRRKNGSWDGGDDILEVLSELDENSYSRTVIRVMMAFWEKERIDIIKKLIEISKRGGTVEIIARNTYKDEVNAELKKLEESGGYIKLLETSKHNLHSKCMIIEGAINGEKQEIILSGSHNYTDGGLKYANEFIIESRNKDYFKDYLKYFDELKSKLDNDSPWNK